MLLINVLLSLDVEFGFLGTFVFLIIQLGMVLPSLLSTRSMISAVKLDKGYAVTSEEFSFVAIFAFFLECLTSRNEAE